ncbi:hypothetical protein [Nocardioides convexus]|uniref:hypothetical protein n=1 Tax=Nocardioides convexus TaxID=2712224 RepID=UPI0024189095|nr:hypothetical protein [Nocardioides convexus]
MARRISRSPWSLAVSGAVAALVVSFTVLVVAWRRPRYDGGQHPGRVASSFLDRVTGSPAFAIALRVVGMVLALYTIFCAVAGQNVLTNPFFGIFYVWWWVGLVFASALLGPVWKAISPVRTLNAGIAKARRQRPRQGGRALPGAARLLAGGARPLRVRVVGARLQVPHRVGLGPLLVCGVRRRDARRGRGLRQPLLRAGRPVRGVLVADREGSPRGPATRAVWWCAARWRTCRRSSRPPAWSVSSACSSGAPPSTRSASPRPG